MERRRRCWRPKQCAPRLSETCLWSEEDLTILRRLQEKYSRPRFPGRTDFRNTTSHTSSGRNITQTYCQIKQEPRTPLQPPASICEPSAAIATTNASLWPPSTTTNQIRDQLTIDRDMNRDLDGSTPQRGSQARVSLTQGGKPQYDSQRTQLHPLVATSGQKRKFVVSDDQDFARMGNSDLYQSKLLNAFEDQEAELSVQQFVPQCSRPKQIKDCSSINGQKQLSLSEYSESWNPYSSDCYFGVKAGDINNCGMQGNETNFDLQEYPMPSRASTDDFARHERNLQQASVSGGRFKTSDFDPNSSVSLEWNEKSSHILPLGLKKRAAQIAAPHPSWLATASSCHGKSRQALPVFNKKEQTSAVSAIKYSRPTAVESEPLPSRSRNATSFVPPVTPLTRRQTLPETSRQHRPSSESPSSPAGSVISGTSTVRKETAGAGKDRHITAATVSSKGNSWAAVATEQNTAGRSGGTCRQRIQQKLKAYPAGTTKGHSTPVDKSDGGTRTFQKDSYTDIDQRLDCIRDVSHINKGERQQMAASLETRSIISIMVMYDNSTTNTDSSLLTKPKVKGLLLHDSGKTYLFPTSQHSDADTYQWSRCVLDAALRREKTVKVAVNCKLLVIALLKEFSLGQNRGILGWQFEDPIIAGWLLNPDDPPHMLHQVCKTVGVSHREDSEPQRELAVSVTVMERLRSRLITEGLWSLFQHVEMPLTPLLAAMELQAIRVNVKTFVTFSEVLKKKLNKVEHRAYQLAGHPFCINSTQQLRQLLYEELKLDQKLPGSRMTLTAITQNKSTSEPMLRQLINTHPLPAVILEYRHLMKLKSTYIDSMLEAIEAGALHTHWDQTAAATGRLASSHPNLQAVPKVPTTITDYEDSFILGSETKSCEIYAREPYICNDGNIFLSADFQQIELRLLAHLTNDPALKEVFQGNNSADVFIQLTAQWLSKSPDDVTHAEREQTKRVVYSIMYGVGKERLAEYLKVSPCRAKDIMDSFLVTFPAIQAFTRKCIDYAKQHGYTETVMGRRRWFPKVHHKAANIRAQAERQAVNFCVQGSAADLCKRAMVRVEQALNEKPHLTARLLIHIHDELVWELPHDQLKETCELIKLVMEDDALLCHPLLSCLRVPVTVSLSSGTSWAHLKPCV